MENLIFTQLTELELRKILSEEIKNALKDNPAPSNGENSDEFLTIQQVSQFTNIAVATLYNYTHKRKIPFSKVGKKLLFSKRELAEWISRHKYNTKSETDTKAQKGL